ncbi:unnamed protein product, partial [Mesorhabditis belari]|uniref:Sulfotransferase n=1 Tax=Mesorhabditis belari TaxID=2138241 RepID=A0AAF3FC74_9BILA
MGQLLYSISIFFLLPILNFIYRQHLYGIPPEKIIYPETGIEAMKLKEESYSRQEKAAAAAENFDKEMPNVVANNSLPLPDSIYGGNYIGMCQNQTLCVGPYARFPSLLVVVPEYRMISCLNQKSLSTVMTGVFCFMNRPEEFLRQNRSLLREYGDIKMCHSANEYHGVWPIFRDLHVPIRQLKKWSFSMVARDPVDRFLSGFVDRCIRTHDSCEGCHYNMTCFLEAELQRAMNYANHLEHKITPEDAHMFPQNWRCQMDKYRYKMLKYSNDPTQGFLQEFKQELDRQNVPSNLTTFIEEELSRGRTAHSTVQSEIRKYLEKRLRSSAYLLELIVRLFYWDYRLLGFAFPTTHAF